MHIREMARVLNKLPDDSRIWKKGGEKPMSVYEYTITTSSMSEA